MSLRKEYSLSYDSSGFNSGLVKWYNHLIDKTYETLDIEDVAKMLRQDILYEVAVEKSVDLFLEDPYDGEYEDGDLLNLLISLELNKINKSIIQRFKAILKSLQSEYVEFEWEEELKEGYRKNIDRMILKLELIDTEIESKKMSE